MHVRAFAKINLSLRVVGRRADGFHELRTIFQSIALHDTLTIRATRGPFRLTCDDPDCPSDDTNLIWRAAERLWRAAGRRGAPRNIAVHLAKRIPLQAGLGGGSSDAAAALRVLGRKWRVDDTEVKRTGAALGADIPFFFEGGTVLGLERGDLLFPLRDHPPAWVVLVLPRFGVSTKEAFGWWDDAHGTNAPVATDPFQGPSQEYTNDLEEFVAAHHPQILKIANTLRKAGGSHVAMSGTGSAVYGLFLRRPVAVAAVKLLAGAFPRTMLTRTLSRSGYRRLAAK